MPSFFQDSPIPHSNVIKQDSFIASILGQIIGVGYQFSNRFLVFIHGPGDKSQFINQEGKNRLAINCTDVGLPAKILYTQEQRFYGPPRKIPYLDTYGGELSLSFNSSTDMFERRYFSWWQNKIINQSTHSPKYYEDYAQPFSITIAVLPKDLGRMGQFEQSILAGSPPSDQSKLSYGLYDANEPNSLLKTDVYYIQLNECYPVEISESSLSSGSNEILKTTVRINFKTWRDPEQILRDQISLRESLLAETQNIIQFDPVAQQDLFNKQSELDRQIAQNSIHTTEDTISPFRQFARTARQIIRYSNHKTG